MQYSNGRPWALVHYMCLFTIIVSSLLGSISTIPILVPLVIRISVAAKIPPQSVVMMNVFAANLGGTMLAIGNPPNIFIISDPMATSKVCVFFLFCTAYFINRFGLKNLNFNNFSAHMIIGNIFVIAIAYVQLRFLYFRKLKHADDLEVGKEPAANMEAIKSEVNAVCYLYQTFVYTKP